MAIVEEPIEDRSGSINQLSYWVNDDNTVAMKRKGEWPGPPDGEWHEVDAEGYQFVMDQIGEVQRAAVLAMESLKNNDKVERLIAAGLDPEVARILVEQ